MLVVVTCVVMTLGVCGEGASAVIRRRRHQQHHRQYYKL
jgi:hypothetical protein